MSARVLVRVGVKIKRSELLVLAVATLLIFIIIFPLGLVEAVSPTAKIVSIDYPRHIFPGKSFPVTLVVDFSDKFGVDVGIWDTQTGLMIQSISIPVPSAGKANFAFKLTAPSAEADWHLLALTRVYWQEAWYQDPTGGSVPFTVTISENVSITLGSERVASTISMDGSQYHVDNNTSATLSVKAGLHRLEASPVVQPEATKRFVFVGWSDGINSNPRQVAFGKDMTIIALYRPEYYLSVKSDKGEVSGAGWYEHGSEATFAVVPSSSIDSVLGVVTDHYRFSAWSGDSSSNKIVASLTMDAPKSVEANWVPSGTTINLTVVADILILAALCLAGRRLYKYRSQRRIGTRTFVGFAKHWARLIVLLFTLLMALVIVPSAFANIPDQPERSIVNIGDASWYYWKQDTSDTCLIWLGGGVSQESVIGYDTYWINPFEYESFGTVRFIQDLAKYYCVIALQKGSFAQPVSSGTIYQEAYGLQSKVVTDVHDWVKEQGYKYTYLVGYSTGAQAAAMEVALRNPDGWISPDGLVIITARLSSTAIQHAAHISTSLLVLYGGSIENPEYIATGKEFYENAPPEGWHGTYYFHKEFHEIEDMGHEVWTAYASGRYDPNALHILVNFIESSKAHQFKGEDIAKIMSATKNSPAIHNSALNLTSVRAPQEISGSQIVVLEAEITYSFQARTLTQIVAFDTRRAQIASATTVSLAGNGTRFVKLTISPSSNSSELSFQVMVLQETDQGWIPAAGPYHTRTTVKNTLTLTLQMSIPNITFLFDGVQYTPSGNGTVPFETGPGIHTVQVQPVLYANKLTRAVFIAWDDGSTETVRQISLDNDTALVAYYQWQYFVNATSLHGEVIGSGWYDENSTATLLVQPPMIEDSGLIFAHWAGDSNDDQPRTLLSVNSTKSAQAIWNTSQSAVEPSQAGALAWLAFSIFTFATALTWNLKRPSQSQIAKTSQTDH